MNNMTTTRTTLSAVVVLMLTASTLVVSSSSILTLPSGAFAYIKKGAQDNGNGNTVTDQTARQNARESGFDNLVEQQD